MTHPHLEQSVSSHDVRYRIGLMGLGSIVHSHIDAIGRVEGLRVSAVCDRDASRLSHWTQSLGCDGYTEPAAFFGSGIDLAVLLLPHHLHAPMAIDAMKAGLHVIVEKPMATCVDDCRTMMQTADATDRLLLIADTAEFTPGALETGRRYRDGSLGKFLAGSMATARRYFFPERPAWFLDPSLSGGGMFANVGIHRLAMARAALPELRPVDVSAAVMRLDDYPVEACTTALVRYANGAAIQHQEIGYVPSPPWMRMGTHLLFERGMVGWDNESWYMSSTDGATICEPLPQQEGYQPIYARVLELLALGSHAGHAQGSAQDVAIVAAAYRSSQLGQGVPIEAVCSTTEQSHV